jgi:hypothetical protein
MEKPIYMEKPKYLRLLRLGCVCNDYSVPNDSSVSCYFSKGASIMVTVSLGAVAEFCLTAPI